MRAPGRWAGAAMIPSGALAGHALGYLLAGDDPALSGAHSHLRPAAWLAAALTLASLAVVACARPGTARPALRLTRLIPSQVALFVTLEAVEHLHAGPGALLADASFRWGVAAQVVSATVLLAAAGLARASGQRLRVLLGRPRASRRRTAPPAAPAPPSPRRSPARASSVSERGPPPRLVPA